MSGTPVKSDFSVTVAKRNDAMRYSVMMFNGMDKVDTGRWSEESHVAMEREDNRGVILATQNVQEYGEGSEYGRAAREEARRKKYGRQSRSYQLDNQPWKLSFNEPEGRNRRMRGIREGGANEHADYWVFLKPTKSDEFQAYKVDEWHKFLPAITHKTLDIDQAEEKFSQRNKVMNQFALKAAIQNQLNSVDDGEEVVANKSLKIKDEASSDESDDEAEEREMAEVNEKKNNKKKKKNVKEKKDKRQRVENAEEVAKYESSDGEDEGREYDYMSDSGSDSEREQVPSDEKVEKQMVGVEEEEGARKMLDSDESDSDEDLTKKLLKTDRDKKKDNADIEERDSSGSDTDDPDSDKINSVMFLPKKDDKGENGGADDKSSSNGAKKRGPTDDGALKDDELGPKDPKKAKTAEKAKFEEGLNEETVRRYLRRKPHTTKELLHKIKGKCGDMNKSEMVTRLAAILKAIDPHQFKQQQGRKEVLFFSLTNTVA